MSCLDVTVVRFLNLKWFYRLILKDKSLIRLLSFCLVLLLLFEFVTPWKGACQLWPDYSGPIGDEKRRLGINLNNSPQLRGRILGVIGYPLLQLSFLIGPRSTIFGLKFMIPECKRISQRRWQSLEKEEASIRSTFLPDETFSWISGYLKYTFYILHFK